MALMGLIVGSGVKNGLPMQDDYGTCGDCKVDHPRMLRWDSIVPAKLRLSSESGSPHQRCQAERPDEQSVSIRFRDN
jgi:hypothetical protein